MLLDHLYGLLDEAEQVEFLADHLSDCPACQAGLEKARRPAEVARRRRPPAGARRVVPEARRGGRPAPSLRCGRAASPRGAAGCRGPPRPPRWSPSGRACRRTWPAQTTSPTGSASRPRSTPSPTPRRCSASRSRACPEFRGRLGAGRERQADLGAEPVDQPPQRRGHVRVGAADAARARAGPGGAPSNGVYAGAAQQRRPPPRGRRRGPGAPGPARRSRRRARRPAGQSTPSAGASSRSAGDVLGPGRRQGAQDADAAVEHEPARRTRPVSSEIWAFHPSTGRSPRRTSVQPPSGGRHHLLLGRAELDGARARPPGSAGARRSRGSSASGSGSVPASACAWTAGVVELGAAAHPGPPQVDPHRLAVGVEVDRPQHGGAELVRQQAGGALAEHRRVQRGPPVGAVERLAAAAGLARRAAPPGRTKAPTSAIA